MSAATAHGIPTLESGVIVMSKQPKQLRPELQEIVSDLLALRSMEKSGILTHRSQRELVKTLNARDMADVARAVSLTEKEQQQTF